MNLYVIWLRRTERERKYSRWRTWQAGVSVLRYLYERTVSRFTIARGNRLPSQRGNDGK